MEHSNATWDNFSAHLINKDVFYQISASFLNDEEQKKAQMASLGQQLKNLPTQPTEHRIDALEGNQNLLTLTRRENRMLQGLVDIVETMDTLRITVERRYDMKKSRSCRKKPQPRKRLRSPRTITKDVDLPTALGIGLVGTMIIGL